MLSSPLFPQETKAAAQPQAKTSPSTSPRSLRTSGWSWVHRKVTDSELLSRRGLCVYQALARFANNNTQTTFASIDRLGRTCHYKRRSVTYALRELEKLGLVETEFHGAPNDGKTSLYRLVCPETIMTALENAAAAKAVSNVPNAEELSQQPAEQAQEPEPEAPTPSVAPIAPAQNCVPEPVPVETPETVTPHGLECKICMGDAATLLPVKETPVKEPPTPTASRQGNGQGSKQRSAKKTIMDALESLFAVWLTLGLHLSPRPSQDPFCHRSQRAIARALKAGFTVEQIAAAIHEYASQFTNCPTGLKYCKKFANFLSHRTWEQCLHKAAQRAEAAKAREQAQINEPEEVRQLRISLAQRMNLKPEDEIFDNSLQLLGYRRNVPLIRVAQRLRDRMFHHVSAIFGGIGGRLQILWEDGYLRNYACRFRPAPQLANAPLAESP
jgi:hypothetical protein